MISRNIILIYIVSISSLQIFSQQYLNVNVQETDHITKKNAGDKVEQKFIAPEGQKFVIFTANTNGKDETKIKVEGKELIFEANDKSYLPVGSIDYGNLRMQAPYFGFETGSDKTIAYVYLVEKNTSKGTFKFGATTPIEAQEFTTYDPQVPTPKSIKVVSSKLIESYSDINTIETKGGFKSEIAVEYAPKKGAFLNLNIEVLPPKKENAKPGENYTFHPNQFYVTSKEGVVFECAAFIRSGDTHKFSESMNHGVNFKETEPQSLNLLFHFGDLHGEFELYHNDVKYATFTVE